MKIRNFIKALLMIGECMTVVALTAVVICQIAGIRDMNLMQVIIGVLFILFCEKIHGEGMMKDGKKS